MTLMNAQARDFHDRPCVRRCKRLGTYQCVPTLFSNPCFRLSSLLLCRRILSYDIVRPLFHFTRFPTVTLEIRNNHSTYIRLNARLLTHCTRMLRPEAFHIGWVQVGKYKRLIIYICHAPILEWPSLSMSSSLHHQLGMPDNGSERSMSSQSAWASCVPSSMFECRVSKILAVFHHHWTPYDKTWQHLIPSAMDYYTETIPIPSKQHIETREFVEALDPYHTYNLFQSIQLSTR